MTQDQLFAKLLSDGLSPAEWRELKNLLADSPQAAEELRELRDLEQSLRDNGLPAGERTDAFLQNVEDRVANVLANQGPSKVAASLGARASFSSAVYLVGALTLLIGIAGFTLLFNPADEQLSLPDRATVENADGQTLNNLGDVNTPVDDGDVLNAADNAAQGIPDNYTAGDALNGDLNSNGGNSAGDHGPEAQTANNDGPAETTALDAATNVNGANVGMLNRGEMKDPTDDLQRKVKQLEIELQSSLDAGNDLNGAMTAHKLAIYWRERGSNYAENSSARFRQAIELAKRAGAESYQAEIIGEHAKLQAALGRKAEARQMMDQCIEILRRLNSDKLARWQAERARL